MICMLPADATYRVCIWFSQHQDVELSGSRIVEALSEFSHECNVQDVYGKSKMEIPYHAS